MVQIFLCRDCFQLKSILLCDFQRLGTILLSPWVIPLEKTKFRSCDRVFYFCSYRNFLRRRVLLSNSRRSFWALAESFFGIIWLLSSLDMGILEGSAKLARWISAKHCRAEYKLLERSLNRSMAWPRDVCDSVRIHSLNFIVENSMLQHPCS